LQQFRRSNPQAWYWPQGAVGYYTLANNIVSVFAYNRRFQPTKVYAAVSDWQNSLLLHGML
jgi:hypothetical protein